MKRFAIEYGMGIDLHGQDFNVAAQRAIKNAISNSCLCGLTEVVGIKDFNNQVKMTATVAVSKPEEIDPEVVKNSFAFGEITVKVVKGGLSAPGMLVEQFGDKSSSAEIAVVAIEIMVDVD